MERVRWLDPDEQQAWRTFLWASRLLGESLDRQMQRDAGMPHTHYIILAMLSEAPERSLTMSQLAQIIRSSASMLSHAVAKLESRGWVRRRRHPGNGRQIIATLTDDGLAALADAAPGHVRQVRAALFDRLSRAQVRQLQEIFQSVLDGLEPCSTTGRPATAPAGTSASEGTMTSGGTAATAGTTATATAGAPSPDASSPGVFPVGGSADGT